MRAFVMVLACSRHMFVRPGAGDDGAAWTSATSRRSVFGRVPGRLVPDNLSPGWPSRTLRPKLDPVLAELAAHCAA